MADSVVLKEGDSPRHITKYRLILRADKGYAVQSWNDLHKCWNTIHIFGSLEYHRALNQFNVLTGASVY